MATAIFLASAGFVFYVIFGYPLLIEAAARLRTRPVKRSEEIKSVSVILSVYNGEKWMRDKLKSILALDYPREAMEVLVLSDGSTDGTDEIVREFASEGVELIRLPRGGKAAALNAGVARARG